MYKIPSNLQEQKQKYLDESPVWGIIFYCPIGYQKYLLIKSSASIPFSLIIRLLGKDYEANRIAARSNNSLTQ